LSNDLIFLQLKQVTLFVREQFLDK